MSHRNCTALTRAAIVVFALPLAACSYMPELPSLPGLGAIKPYRIDIQQGNFLSAEMVAQLKVGMTREQVRFVLGTPFVTDIFHGDRWDYVFYRELGDGTKERRRLSVFFEDNKLARFTGDNLPQAAPPPAPAAAAEPKAGAEQVAAPKGETKN